MRRCLQALRQFLQTNTYLGPEKENLCLISIEKSIIILQSQSNSAQMLRGFPDFFHQPISLFCSKVMHFQ